MTTIAANLEEIAGDGLMRTGDRIDNYNEPKLWRCGESIFGFAGQAEMWVIFKQWKVNGGDQKPTAAEGEFGVLELAPDGLFHWPAV